MLGSAEIIAFIPTRQPEKAKVKDPDGNILSITE
jgi:hypothetical protein